jgi:hypothetical protein
MKIFISHATIEEDVAGAFQDWIEKKGERYKCHCTSNPMNNSGGDNWLKSVIEEAKESAVFIQFLSPYSMANKWINFESGIATASDTTRMIPLIFGGGDVEQFKAQPLGALHRQAVILDRSPKSKSEFHAFCVKSLDLPDIQSKVTYFNEFWSTLSKRGKRVFLFGPPGSLQPLAKLSKPTGVTQFKKADNIGRNIDPIYLNRYDQDDGEIIAIRVRFRPIHVAGTDTKRWKFGVALSSHDNENGEAGNEVFMLHASIETNMSTWTLYKDRNRERGYNVPAQLEWNKEAAISLWLSSDATEVTAVGVSTNKEIAYAVPDLAHSSWIICEQDWKFIKIKSWNDSQPHPYEFRVWWEIDRLKH